MNEETRKILASKTGSTYLLSSRKQTTEADIQDLHHLIAQLLVDDDIESKQQNKTTA